MITKTNPSLRVVLYEGTGSASLGDDERFETMSALLDKGYSVTHTHGPGRGGTVVPSNGSPLLVIGRFKDQWPTDAIDPDHGSKVTFENITGQDAKAISATVEKVSEAQGEKPSGPWKPWFPVIDYDRCTNCMQCLSFCLFDVYAVDDKEQITVQNQQKCKTDCPACSRVCPEVAILFPKYGKGPINGDVVRESDVLREAMKVDISALLGGDIYSALRSRQSDARKRFSTERDESKALLERKRCLKKLQGTLDIPDEVLMSLPTVENIEDRARRARAKAEKRKARSQTVKDNRPLPSQDDWGI